MFRRWDCTKIRRFLEEKKAKWMIDNLEEHDIKILYDKVRECSPAAAAKIYRVMHFIKEAIHDR